MGPLGIEPKYPLLTPRNDVDSSRGKIEQGLFISSEVTLSDTTDH